MDALRKNSLNPDENGDARGASIVEFALVLPLLLLIVFGMIQFGMGWWLSQVVTNGAREGARFGVVVRDPPVSDTDVRTKINSYLNASGVNATSSTIQVSYRLNGTDVGYAACVSGCEVKVSVSVPIQNISPTLLPFFPTQLKAISVMRHE